LRIEISFRCNGQQAHAEVRPETRLIDLLRNKLGLTGTKEGCGEGECGACTVLVQGRPVNSCLYPAPEIDGLEVTTIEGLGEPGPGLSPLQQAFVDCGGIQCGFCSPGMILAAKALLDRTPDPSAEQIRSALAGNLCRCTGYVQIVEAVREAGRRLREAAGEDVP